MLVGSREAGESHVIGQKRVPACLLCEHVCLRRQINTQSNEGEQFRSFYPRVVQFPFVGVIDARTGELLAEVPSRNLGLEGITEQRMSSLIPCIVDCPPHAMV